MRLKCGFKKKKKKREREIEEVSVHSGRMIHEFGHPVDLHVKLCW